MIGGVAALAATAGVGWAWWRTANAGDSGMWSLRFETPAGGELRMASFRGKPLVLNFWATWCAPCLKEMPQLERFHREFGTRGWQVLGLALDRAGPVNEFLTRVRVGFPIALAGVDGFDLTHELGNGQGVLPFTVVFDRRGQPVHRKVGETSFDELAGWARAMKAG
jgi:thiol-disulfide isomerase/thioredoxin